MLTLYNTLTKKKEVFKPIKEGQVGMYNCGPTVYDYVHIGNLRSYVFADILRRTLEYNGYAVRQIINITDFGHLSSDADVGEDKMLKGLKREGKPLTVQSMRELASTYAEAFKKDILTLNIKMPTALPYASEHIPEQTDIIRGLEEKGFTYTTTDGVYFDTSADKHYGRLGGLPDINQEQSRIDSNPEKKNPRDFALWKRSKTIGWDSPWGKGFPGWHIECSAMSMKYLGDHFDIHTGGIDHIPTHHNNEIAQSENFTGKVFVNYWLHNAFITINADKMAKSAGGFITRRDIEEKGFDPLAYRYWLLTAQYRTPADFTWGALEGAQNAFSKLKNRILELGNGLGSVDKKYKEKFTEYINDDLDTPGALALLWNILKDTSLPDENKKVTVLDFDSVLGLGLSKIELPEIPEEIKNIVMDREKARESENWKLSDELRKRIEKMGYEIKDTDNGPIITKK